MGAVNKGDQSITFGYHLDAKAENFNKLLHRTVPRGIYKGGWLTKVTDTSVTLSPFNSQIGDGNTQVGAASAASATLDNTTLDGGTISSSTPFLVLRWAFSEAVSNYVEIHALSSLTVKQANDVVIGKCVFSGATLTGFDYSDRTEAQIQDIHMRVEATEETELFVRVRGGRVRTGSASTQVAAQKVGPFAVPSSPNSRIDLVYVDSSGIPQILQGEAGTSPTEPGHRGLLVLAAVTLANGATNIQDSIISDRRSFLQPSSITDDTTIRRSTSTGKLELVGSGIVEKKVYTNISLGGTPSTSSSISGQLEHQMSATPDVVHVQLYNPSSGKHYPINALSTTPADTSFPPNYSNLSWDGTKVYWVLRGNAFWQIAGSPPADTLTTSWRIRVITLRMS